MPEYPLRYLGGTIYKRGVQCYAAQVNHEGQRFRRQFSGTGALDQAKGWIESTCDQVEKERAPLSAYEINQARIALDMLPEGVDLVTAARHYLSTRAGNDPRPLAEAIEEYLDEKWRAGLRPATVAGYRQHLARLVADMPGAMTDTVTAEALRTWCNACGLQGRTRRNYRASLRAFWSWCIERGYAAENPAAGIDVHIVDETLAEIWPVETVEAFMAAVPADLAPPCALGFFAGIRTAEIGRLDWGSINSEHIHVGPQVAKKRRQRFVTIPSNLAAWLDAYRGTGPVWPASAMQLSRRIRGVLASSQELPDSWPTNVMRHSFASYHLALYQDAPRTALQLGHTRPDILFNHYRNLATEDQGMAFFDIRPR